MGARFDTLSCRNAAGGPVAWEPSRVRNGDLVPLTAGLVPRVPGVAAESRGKPPARIRSSPITAGASRRDRPRHPNLAANATAGRPTARLRRPALTPVVEQDHQPARGRPERLAPSTRPWTGIGGRPARPARRGIPEPLANGPGGRDSRPLLARQPNSRPPAAASWAGSRRIRAVALAVRGRPWCVITWLGALLARQSEGGGVGAMERLWSRSTSAHQRR
jgi:hypothetical protein